MPRRNPDVYGLVLLHLTYQGNMQLVQLLLPVPPKKRGNFGGAPRRDQISSAEINSACGKVLLRKTLVVEQKQQGRGDV